MDSIGDESTSPDVLNPGVSQRYRRVFADGKNVFLAGDAIAIPPQLGARRAHFQVEPASIRQFDGLGSWLGGSNLGVSQRHVRVSAPIPATIPAISLACHEPPWTRMDMKCLFLRDLCVVAGQLRTSLDADANFRSSAAWRSVGAVAAGTAIIAAWRHACVRPLRLGRPNAGAGRPVAGPVEAVCSSRRHRRHARAESRCSD